MINMLKFRKLFKGKDDEQKKELVTTHQTLKNKYCYFKLLLEHNDNVLMAIADIEDKLKAEYLFDQHYVKTSVETISRSVSAIIDNLNRLSDGKYERLNDRFKNISSEIEEIVSPRRDIPVSDLVIPLEQLRDNMIEIAGGKIARLGDIKNRLLLPAPDGFSITAYSFKRFMEHNKLADKVNSMLPGLSVSNMDEIIRFCGDVRKEVMNAEVPSDLQNAIEAGLTRLKSLVHPSPLMVSVRSSATQEDGEISFAGQYATFLNVPGSFAFGRELMVTILTVPTIPTLL